ncbi:ECF transporter S component [Allonocardiopsis opalescens]|uniref:Energy-coupling factor transport system substrate-specific component n=1 Tax=Allonocardiopsis opalescens TaxID=1144618 RepID=A0A2T0PXQ0_9ACTN|nr:ECF transporter S component [Allonocardiopsis opalescens]PRX96218.1 energy-coupling factor transport system substrate-specific component [Allonocardiopsis opalescens]
MTDPHPTAARHPGHRWRTVDIVVTAVLGVAVGVVFWAWGLAWNIVQPAFLAFPPGQGLMYGVWLLPGVLGGLVVRKRGAAVFTSLVASAVSAWLGTSWGVTVILYGLLQGLAPELVFAAGRYLRWGRGTALLAGAAAGLVAAVLDIVMYYPTWPVAWMAVYAAVLAVSAAAIAGMGGWLLVRALGRAGALTPFLSARG